MPTLWPMAFALLACAQPHAAPALSPRDVVAALETAMGDAIARAEGAVVAIAREKSDNDETLAVRGREPGPDVAVEPRFGAVGGLVIADPFLNNDVVSFDYGSGVVIGANEILTAYHVVRGARALHVRAAGRQGFEAEIIAADPRSDLAVIVPRESPGVPAPKLTPLTIGDATRLRKGAFLVALGNPFNAARDGRASASWGILANVARRIDPSSEDMTRQGQLQLRNYPTLFQLDAKLNLGMSGGAVIDMRGELVALTTAAANAAGFDAQAGYAIPMDTLGRNVVEALRQGKEYEYGLLGINLDRQNGTSKVMSANPGTPAALGGVQVGDEIVDVGGIPVVDSDSLVVAINSVPAGETVKLRLRRHDQPKEIERTVRLAKLKLNGPVIATNRPAPWRGLRVDYTSTTFEPAAFDLMAHEGVVVTEVETGSEADKAGLKPGQFITRVDTQAVRNPRDFAQAAAGLKGPVKLETELGTVTVK